MSAKIISMLIVTKEMRSLRGRIVELRWPRQSYLGQVGMRKVVGLGPPLPYSA